MTALFLVGMTAMVFFLIPGQTRTWRRMRTRREEQLHHQIQQAMNWEPEHFHLCEDGKYRNAYGTEGIRMTLKELMDHEKSQ